MEKIYMEETYNRKRRSGMNLSVVLSFAVAIFAIFSLATYGVVRNQGMDAVSYAAPLGTTNGNSFSFTWGVDSSNEDLSIVSTGSSGGSVLTFPVPIYLADGDMNKPVFCVEHNVNPPSDGATVEKDGVIDDYGLLWILNNSYANGRPRTNITENGKYIEEWITQVAIWMYLYETQGDKTASGVSGIYDYSTGDFTEPHDNVKVNYLRPEDVSAIKAATQLELKTISSSSVIYPASGGTAVNLYDTYVKPLVDEAKEASNKKMLAVTKAAGDVSKTSDEKYYQSTLFTVVGYPSSDLTNYDISLSGIEGAFIVDEEGQVLDMTGIDAGKGFYVRIPVDKVTEKAQTINVTAVGHFNTLTGHYFMGTNAGNALQKVITVTGTTKDVEAGNSVTFVGSPDTGINTAQTIYFIGLIVLLCGVGIIYANAKPVEQKQQ